MAYMGKVEAHSLLSLKKCKEYVDTEREVVDQIISNLRLDGIKSITEPLFG